MKHLAIISILVLRYTVCFGQLASPTFQVCSTPVVIGSTLIDSANRLIANQKEKNIVFGTINSFFSAKRYQGILLRLRYTPPDGKMRKIFQFYIGRPKQVKEFEVNRTIYRAADESIIYTNDFAVFFSSYLNIMDTLRLKVALKDKSFSLSQYYLKVVKKDGAVSEIPLLATGNKILIFRLDHLTSYNSPNTLFSLYNLGNKNSLANFKLHFFTEDEKSMLLSQLQILKIMNNNQPLSNEILADYITNFANDVFGNVSSTNIFEWLKNR